MHFNLNEEYRFVRIEYLKRGKFNTSPGTPNIDSVKFQFIEPLISLEIVRLKCVETEKVAYVGESDKKYDAFIFDDDHGHTWFNQYPLFFQPDNGHLYPVSVNNSYRNAILKSVKNAPFIGTSWMTEITSYLKHLDVQLASCKRKSTAAKILRLKGDIDHLLDNKQLFDKVYLAKTG